MIWRISAHCGFEIYRTCNRNHVPCFVGKERNAKLGVCSNREERNDPLEKDEILCVSGININMPAKSLLSLST